jgi:hypothetical protein
MCNKKSARGVEIHGIGNKYRVCSICLAKHSNAKPTQSNLDNMRYNRNVLQSEIDAKLQYYLIDQIIEDCNLEDING